ncbi:nodulation S family protein [Sphingomonas sp. BGYR3]|uniref:nodulation S family protein n=1 Tax=Sphingomonas sp. BGYR3 TaxID=2975483 RepID=UPI0021A67245|nr:nodulation S family protein [Sphingomonas sp. BGYR3]MDG5487816.1 nodulation S family protein [Sphingomonas sp. BGYR3]
MTRNSLGPDYFEGIFQGDADPWGLDSSEYERAKFDATIAALNGRRYRSALEIGCANGALTERLAPCCDRLLAIDISGTAVADARRRLAPVPTVSICRMRFPEDQPDARFDLILLSEVAYYWSDADLAAAGGFIGRALDRGGDILLVHYTGQTDYPQTADDAVQKLRSAIARELTVGVHHRADRYRIDLWRAG